jgi:hypothetical protein
VIEGKEQRLAVREGQEGSLPLITVTSYEMMRRLTCRHCCMAVNDGT